jgi:dephospho-CoA kinase
MLRVGLTGGISSGKSTAGKFFAGLGAAVFDADEIVAGLYGSGKAGAREVGRLFGEEFLTPDGAVDKPRLAKQIFSDAAARRRLEAAIHPLVAEEIRRRFGSAEEEGRRVAVAEASQILEGGYEREFDRIVLVVSPEIARRKRWRERGHFPD